MNVIVFAEQFISPAIKLTDIEFTFHRILFALVKTFYVAELTKIVRPNNLKEKTSLLAQSCWGSAHESGGEHFKASK